MLLDNLQNEYKRMVEDDHNVVIAKKILVQMRYFMMNFTFAEEIIEQMSNMVDEIMHNLNSAYIFEKKTPTSTVFIN